MAITTCGKINKQDLRSLLQANMGLMERRFGVLYRGILGSYRKAYYITSPCIL